MRPISFRHSSVERVDPNAFCSAEAQRLEVKSLPIALTDDQKSDLVEFLKTL
jgi:hypothetical protein